MQKKIIALAVAALASSAAFAQSNVTIYGIADAGLNAVTTMGNGGQTQYNVASGMLSTSRIGFKGVEDLGNGLKALFTLEYGLNIDANQGIGTSTTAGAANARQQFVGLTGGFGTVVAGRLQTTGLDFTVAGTALGGSTALGATNVVSGANGDTFNGALISAFARADNAIAYISPSFAGVTVAYNHARLSECAGVTTANRTCDAPLGNSDSHADLISVSYDNGPITAGAIYTRATPITGADDNTNEWGIRAGYDFKVVKVQGTYQRLKAQAADDSNSKYALSVAVPVGAKAAVIAEYAKAKLVGDNNDVSAGTLAATYSLSKRTTAYAGMVMRRAQASSLNTNVDTNTYALGLRHSF